MSFVDIDGINPEGLLYDDKDVVPILEKFRKEKVDGLFVPHCNFGTEYVMARLARELGVPVLLWGPRDERPDENGVRLRDSQCGLFATGKVLRRFQVPFTYMTNCRLTDPEFERGVKDFLAVCNVVKVFRHTRILQIAPRPFDFWSTMCNGGFFPEEDLLSFSQFGSKYIGHPNNKVSGIEMNSGSLGHGLSVGVGMALAGKRQGKPYRVYVVMGDGELAEGSVWEEMPWRTCMIRCRKTSRWTRPSPCGRTQT